MLAGVFVNRLAGFLQIFLILFLTHRGFSKGEAGIALGVYAVGAVLGTVIGGWLSDRLGPRPATVISMMGAAVLLVAIVYLKIYPLLLAAVLLVGAVGVIYRPAAQSLITGMAPQGQLVMVTAMYRLCLNLGTTAAPVIGGLLVQASYLLLFWGEAIGALLFGLIALRYLPRQPKQARPTAQAEAEPGEAQPQTGYRALLGDPRFLVFLAGFLLICLVYSQYTAVLPLAVEKARLSIWWYIALVSLNAAIVVTCEVLATKWVQKWPTRVTVMTGFSLLALGYGIYAIKMIPVLLVLGTLTWTLSEITGTPTVYAYPGMIAPAHLRGRYYGALQSVYSLGAVLGPIGGVFLFIHIGQTVFVYCALIAVAGAVVGTAGIRQTSQAGPGTPDAEAAAGAVAADVGLVPTEPPGEGGFDQGGEVGAAGREVPGVAQGEQADAAASGDADDGGGVRGQVGGG
jgi:MFS family permease